MRLLDRYLLREFLVPLGYCLGGFFVFWITFDCLSEMAQFQSAKLDVPDVAAYYLLKSPEFLLTIVPVALLLAVLYALTNHARHHELTAMRAAGVSLWRLAAPYFAVALVASLSLLAMNELLAPRANEMAEEILAPRASAGANQWQREIHFMNDAVQRVWRIRSYNVLSHEMLDPSVEWHDSGARRVLLATGAVRTNGVWVFSHVRLFTYPPGMDVPQLVVTNTLAVPEFNESPRLIASEIKVSQMSSVRAAKRIRFTLAEILDYRRLHPQLRSDMRALLGTQFHGRLAAPWTCLVVVFIALPFGALTGRRNVFVGVAASVFICFAFFIVSRLGLALGTSGNLPAWLAAWGPHLLFSGIGVWFTQKLR